MPGELPFASSCARPLAGQCHLPWLDDAAPWSTLQSRRAQDEAFLPFGQLQMCISECISLKIITENIVKNQKVR